MSDNMKNRTFQNQLRHSFLLSIKIKPLINRTKTYVLSVLWSTIIANFRISMSFCPLWPVFRPKVDLKYLLRPSRTFTTNKGVYLIFALGQVLAYKYLNFYVVTQSIEPEVSQFSQNEYTFKKLSEFGTRSTGPAVLPRSVSSKRTWTREIFAEKSKMQLKIVKMSGKVWRIYGLQIKFS